MISSLARNRLRRAGMLVLALILVTTGSYVRTRSVEEANSMDWLVLVQLALSAAGGSVGILLFKQHPTAGFGAKVLFGYLLAVLASTLVTPYFTMAFGYWILLTGTSLLCIGLISSSVTEESLREVEHLIFATLAFMLLKDTLIDTFYFRSQFERMEELGIEMYRYGMGSTSSNSMGLIAAAAFWMSFRTAPEPNAKGFLGFFWKALFAAVVVLTRARVALGGIVGGIALRWWYVHRQSKSIHANAVLVAVPCMVASFAVLISIGWIWRAPLIADTINFVNRGEDTGTMMSVTGRTDVWPYALQRITEGPVSFLLGHGYGASKYVLNENNWNASFFAYHAHNTFLEILLSTGVLAFLPFAALALYSLTWLFRFSSLLRSFSLGFTLRAITVVSAMLSSTITESELATKLGPVLIVFLFYGLSLDRRAAFLPAAGSDTETTYA